MDETSEPSSKQIPVTLHWKCCDAIDISSTKVSGIAITFSGPASRQ